ncbi:MAG TPA: hypothetical protein PKH50_01480 [bacterium]|jgi:hypothetical protein|nr:hypothetical protein [bacterium]
MPTLKIILTIYLILGFIYAVFVAIKGPDEWYWFPVNWLLGPLTVLYLLIIVAKGKRLPTDW